jgi:hypothetical protein
MKPLYFFFILFFCHFNSTSQKTLTNGIYILDGGTSNWYDNEFFVRFYDKDSLIFGQLMFPDSIKSDSMGQYLNELTFVKRAYLRKNDKISFIEEMIHESKVLEYKILLTSDTTLWLSCDDKTSKKFEVHLKFKFINVDYLDQNVTFVDPHVYKIISDMPHPNSTFLSMNIKVIDAIRKIKASENYEKCTTVITFTILEDGRCINWEIQRSTCWDLADSILEEFKKTSPWKPGTHRSRRVKCRYVIPFKLKN